jgi:hypothetical protein
MIFSGTLFSQGFETSHFIDFHGGISFPSGSNNNRSIFNTSIGLPLNETFLASGQLSLMATTAESPVVFISGNVSLPFAIESASTPYVFAGLGAISAEKNIRFGLNTGVGYLFAHEQWRSTFLDLQLRYQRNFENIPWEDISLSFGVGFHLNN